MLIDSLQRLLEVLRAAGFMINVKKSQLNPSQELVFLGMTLNTIYAKSILPLQKAQMLRLCASLFMTAGVYRPARLFLRLLGMMSAANLMVPLGRLYMRPFQIYLHSRWKAAYQKLSHPVMVPAHLLPHVQWWRDLNNLTQGLCWKKLGHQVILTTDASESLWGGHMKGFTAQGPWTKIQHRLHINHLEMWAVLNSLQTFRSMVEKRNVLVRTDNTTVCQYINKCGGTRSPDMCKLTWRLFQWCIQHQVEITAVHLPGVLNVQADSLSRHWLPQLEWTLNQTVADQIFHHWFIPDLDLFATYENKRVPEFCTFHPHPKAFWVDALSLSWRDRYVYAYPPIALIHRVLLQVQEESPVMILIAPLWSRREWFPLLLDLLVDYPIRLPQSPDLLTQNQGTHLHSSVHELNLVAWLISGDHWLRKEFQRALPLQSSQPPPLVRTSNMLLVGSISPHGVLHRKLIPVLPLCR
jgi:hypothetical protein